MATNQERLPEFRLSVNNLSKKFNQQKLFSALSFDINTNDILAVTGANGSGKSTLLKIIVGINSPTKGAIQYFANQQRISPEELHSHINICAPYLDLIEEFTLAEHLDFHSKFKPQLDQLNIAEHVKAAGLDQHYNKMVSAFSSGMKQRLKLLLAFCYQGNFLFLDEPTSHLDAAGKSWYRTLLTNLVDNRIILIFSNESEEYISFTKKIVNIESIKLI